MGRPVWDRIQEIYYSALPMAKSARRAFLDSACGADLFLLQEVRSLLDAEGSLGDFLNSPVFEMGLMIITNTNPDKLEDSSVPPVDELIGLTIDGRYLVEKQIGHGGIGSVYLARDITLHNKPIVIKVLLQASLRDPYVVKKFRQEVEALARIDHPGVVSILGAGELADGKPYIGMQYVSGVTLRSQMPSEGMNLERAASILKQIGAALDNVHEKGIFHRDLKPENIMLQVLKGGTELVKIVDFGIAKVNDSVIAPSTVNETPIGTVLYMSPEQLRGERVAATSDIYSMALIAYEVVSGRRPFNPSSAPQLLEMHRAGVRVKPVDLRFGLGTEAQAIILRALSFERIDRYQSAGEFGDSLARALTSDQERVEVVGSQGTAEGPPIEPIKPPSLSGSPAEIQPVVAHSLTPSLTKSGIAATSSTLRRGMRSPWVWVSGTSLLILIFGALVGVNLFRRSYPGLTSGAQPSRSFNYWLTIQKMRDGRLYQEPFLSSGQEIFETGYKFRLNVSSPDPGFLYVFDEGRPEADGTGFTMVYPIPSSKNAYVSNQPVHTNWNTFRGHTGTETLWIVWSVSPIDQFESAKTEAFENEKGALTNANSIRLVREFLLKYVEPKPESTKDIMAQQTHIRGGGKIVVTVAELQFR